MEPVVGDVVDVAELRARMTDAVRQAGTGTAHFADDAGEWHAEVTFSVGADGVAIRLDGMPYSYSRCLVADGTLYGGSSMLEGFWDSKGLTEHWVAGDPLVLVASLPDGDARVVDTAAGVTTYRLTADEGALAAFCDSAWPLDDPEPGTMTAETLWTLDDESRVVSIRRNEGYQPWDDITFGDWGAAEPVVAPPPVPAWPAAAPPAQGELEVHVLAMRLSGFAVRQDGFEAVVFVAALHPTERNDRSRRIDTRLWVVNRPAADGSREAGGVAREDWVCVDNHFITTTETFMDVIARQPHLVGGRQPSFLVCRITPAEGGKVLCRYGWTYHPDLLTTDAPAHVSGPAWVKAALTAVGMTPD